MKKEVNTKEDFNTTLMNKINLLTSGLDYLKVSMGELRTELKNDMGELRTELKNDMGELRGNMNGIKDEINQIKLSIVDVRKHVTSIDEKLAINNSEIVAVRKIAYENTEAIKTLDYKVDHLYEDLKKQIEDNRENDQGLILKHA